jgi:hypothetical protein
VEVADHRRAERLVAPISGFRRPKSTALHVWKNSSNRISAETLNLKGLTDLIAFRIDSAAAPIVRPSHPWPLLATVVAFAADATFLGPRMGAYAGQRRFFGLSQHR